MPDYTNYIRDVLITIHMNLHDLEERKGFANPEELGHIEAKLIAYREMLSILGQSATEFGLPKEELGM
jgi:hypothetical protein